MKERQMFCDKGNVNALTSLLLSHGIRTVVMCPGSRNAVLAHNFYQLSMENGEEGDGFLVIPATDERSAAFIALGTILATGEAAAVCVTSGSALLAALPAAAEAMYRRLPLLVISADRPPLAINQLDGQTIPQEGALKPYAETYNVPEIHNEEDAWWANRQINEALNRLKADACPVHINVPITEPLFSFTTDRLHAERVIREVKAKDDKPLPEELVGEIAEAKLPVLLIGHKDRKWSVVRELEQKGCVLVLPEIVANEEGCLRNSILENGDLGLQPDVLIHVGGNMVNKRLKLKLRKEKSLKVVRISSEKTGMPDTFHHLHYLVRCNEESALAQLALQLPAKESVVMAKKLFLLMTEALGGFKAELFSDVGVMKQFFKKLEQIRIASLHLANSSPVRNAAFFYNGGRFPIYCNRGVNGIEGSLSAAVGNSLMADGLVFCTIGDLSFFYDQNALWEKKKRGNLRILLFNNGGGQIFRQLPGLEASAARDEFVAAHHGLTAEAVALTFGLDYASARSYEELEQGLDNLVSSSATRPVLLEVFTSAVDDDCDLSRIKTMISEVAGKFQNSNYFVKPCSESSLLGI